MAILKTFRGIRPRPELASQVAAPPYDVLSSEEAREMAVGNDITFLHINKPEIDLDPAIDPYDPRVYEKGAENLQRFLSEGIISQDVDKHYYVYRQVMGNHEQTGLVALASVDEYEQGIIKKHEFTRPQKEDDRVNHIDTVNAQVGPVFLTYRSEGKIDELIASVTAGVPDYDFVIDGVRHVLWVVRDTSVAASLETAFAAIPCLYVADGHHRSAAASRVRQKRRQANPSHRGDEAYNYFLSVVFPHDQMRILDYNRVVKDLNGMTEEDFLDRLEDRFEVSPSGHAVKPAEAHEFGMYLGGRWFTLKTRTGVVNDDDPVSRLDVAVLQDNVLSPLLGIDDPRVDDRIDFVGGIRGMEGLVKRVDSGEYAVAFSCYPTSIEDLMAIADAGEVMPPKSTWFEPKLKSGLVIHSLADD